MRGNFVRGCVVVVAVVGVRVGICVDMDEVWVVTMDEYVCVGPDVCMDPAVGDGNLEASD